MIEFTHSIVGCDDAGAPWCCGAGVFDDGQATYSTMHETGAGLLELFARPGWRWAVAVADGGVSRQKAGCRLLPERVTFDALCGVAGTIVLRAPTR